MKRLNGDKLNKLPGICSPMQTAIDHRNLAK